MMTRSGRPDLIGALTIIRNLTEQTPGSAISSVALFAVARSGRCDVRFRMEHVFFDPDHSRDEIIDALCQRIPSGAELLVRLPRAATRRLRRSGPNSRTPLPLDIELIARRLSDGTILPVNISEGHLTEAGESLGLDMPRRGCIPIRWRRRAQRLVQALWSTYVSAFCPFSEQRILIAAHKAWLLIEKARAG